MVAAGSWDHFHGGHRQFLTEAFLAAEKVSVGITAQEMIAGKPFAHSLELFEQRKHHMEEFLKEKELGERARLIMLTDVFGTAITDPTIEALLVTAKTHAGGEMVNRKRDELHLPPLQLIEVALLPAADGREISSERIRGGEINREGLVYMDIFATTKILPERLRSRLQKPFGELILGEQVQEKLRNNNPIKVISVGDVVSQYLVANDFMPDIAVIDLMVERQKKYRFVSELGLNPDRVVATVENPAGMIMPELASSIFGAMSNGSGQVVLVRGEEDLAVLPAILAAPLGSVVIYGQPHEGVVWVEVTEAKKTAAYELGLLFGNRH